MNKIRIFTQKIIYIPRKIKQLLYIKLNIILFYLLGIKLGKNPKIYNQIYLAIHHNSEIVIGNNFTFTNGSAFNPISRNIKGCIHTQKGASIYIGDNVGISSCCLWAKENITIGNNVKIGSDTIIMDTDAHNLDHIIRNSEMVNEKGESIDGLTAASAPIIIKEGVLIGTRCIILKGVTIGKNSIIGSGSIVTKSIPDNCIAAGNPCKIIKEI